MLLLAGALAGCGGRSERASTLSAGAEPCVEPLEFPDPALDQAVRQGAGFTPDHSITTEDALGIRSLYVAGASSLEGLECLTELRSLTARDGPIVDIGPLAELRKLEWLDLSANSVKSLAPLENHTELRWVDLTRNAVEDLAPLSGNRLLFDLRIDFNQVRSLEPLSGLPISNLIATNNDISELSPVASMDAIRELSISYNPVRDLSPLAGRPMLEVLRANATEITDLSALGKNALLRRLHVDHNRITDLTPLSLLPGLSVVHARDNQIESLAGVTLPEPRCGGALELVDNPLESTGVAALCAAGWVIRYGDPLAPEQCNLDCLQ